MAVCSEIHTKNINTVCGENEELLNVKLAVHIVTTGLYHKAQWLFKYSKMYLCVLRISGQRAIVAFIIIGIQPLGRFGQRPELSQSTGIALVRCILGKFLGVVCHCFPPIVALWSINCNS